MMQHGGILRMLLIQISEHRIAVPFLFACYPTANSTQKTGQTRFGFPLFLCLMQPRHSREKCLSLGNVLVSLLTTWEKDSSAYRCEKDLLGEWPKKGSAVPSLVVPSQQQSHQKASLLTYNKNYHIITLITYN